MKRLPLLIIPIVAISAIGGWQLNSLASAASASKKVCLSTAGKISRRATCNTTETEIAAARVRSKSIKKRLVGIGNTKLSPGVGVTASGVSVDASSTELSLVATLGASVRSYTNALTFPSSWTGSVATSCASNEIAVGAYAEAYIDGKRLPKDTPDSGWGFSSGLINRYRISDPGREYLGFVVQFANATLSINEYSLDGAPEDLGGPFIKVPIPATLTLYTTQLCAPLTTLEGVG